MNYDAIVRHCGGYDAEPLLHATNNCFEKAANRQMQDGLFSLKKIFSTKISGSKPTKNYLWRQKISLFPLLN